jgi:hypothetical protein
MIPALGIDRCREIAHDIYHSEYPNPASMPLYALRWLKRVCLVEDRDG